MQFEVFIPAPEEDGFDVTLCVDAKNWMLALRAGLQRTYNEDNPVRNVFCDIKDDDVIHVTDLASRRVFKIRRQAVCAPVVADSHAQSTHTAAVVQGPNELSVNAPNPGRFRHPKEFPAVGALAGAVRKSLSNPTVGVVPRLKSGQPLGITASSGKFRPISEREVEAVRVDTGAPKILRESVSPTSQQIQALRIGRNVDAEEAWLGEAALEDVFAELSELFEGGRSLEEVVGFALDLAMRHVPAESGSILFADETGSYLYFASACGPKASELMEREFTIPIDRGIVGFCTRAGVSLAVSDATRDPRFFEQISLELGYTVRAVLCAPIQWEGRVFGALELINRDPDRAFLTPEINLVAYIAGQTGRFITDLLD